MDRVFLLIKVDTNDVQLHILRLTGAIQRSHSIALIRDRWTLRKMALPFAVWEYPNRYFLIAQWTVWYAQEFNGHVARIVDW